MSILHVKKTHKITYKWHKWSHHLGDLIHFVFGLEKKEKNNLISLTCALQSLSRLKTTFDYFFSLQIGLPLTGVVTTILANGRSIIDTKLKQIKLIQIVICSWQIKYISLTDVWKDRYLLDKIWKLTASLLTLVPSCLHCLSARVLWAFIYCCFISRFFTFHRPFPS